MPSFPVLEKPPIDEVVCGIVFEPLALDALDFGVYWESRRTDFPKKQLHSALLDGGGMVTFGGVSPIRVWMVAENDATLVQLQHDRFYMNWRARGPEYPRFGDDDRKKGLRSMVADEFEKFGAFAQMRTETRPVATRIDLQKINLLYRGKHWHDLSDLSALLPIVTTFDKIRTGENLSLVLRLAEHTDAGTVTVQISSRTDKDQRIDAIRIDAHTNRSVASASEVVQAFTDANNTLNGAFFGLLEDNELHRFKVADKQ